MWSSDYLRNLPPAVSKQFHVRNIKCGDLVLIEGDNTFSHLTWPLGIVQNIFTGPDNICRSFELKTAKGILRRSIQCLHSLEAVFKNHAGEIPIIANTRDIHINATYEGERPLNANNNHTGENLYNLNDEPNYFDSIFSEIVPGEIEPPPLVEPPRMSPEVPEVPEIVPEVHEVPESVPEVPLVPVVEPSSPEVAPQRYTTRVGRTIRPRNILDL